MAIIPATIDSTGKLTGQDATGNPLINKGRVRYNPQIVNNAIYLFDGIASLSFSDLTGITITLSIGTSVPTININSINFTAGTLEYLALSNGSIYTCAETGGNISYDIVNSLHATIVSLPVTFHSNAEETDPDNILNGFDLWQNDITPTDFIRVPFDINKNSIKTSGDAITGYTWISRNTAGAWSNDPGSEFIWPKAHQIIESDSLLTSPYLTDGSGNMVQISHDEIVDNVQDENVIFANVNDPLKKQDIVILDADYSPAGADCLKAIFKLTKSFNEGIEAELNFIL